MPSMRNPAPVLLAVLLAVALATCFWMWNRQKGVKGESAAALETALKEKAAFGEQAAALKHENDTLRQQLADRGIEPAVAPNPVRRVEGEAKRLEAIRELTQAQTKLSEAQATIISLQNRSRDLEVAAEKAVAESRRLAAEEAGLREDLDAARRLVAVTETELKTKAERLTQLEAANRRVREDLTGSVQKSSQAAELANELFDINRRRENVISNLQRRYREMTDNLRALAVRLDAQRDNPSTAVTDISRMQSTALSADDDLRQLSSLNAQAQRITQKMGQK